MVRSLRWLPFYADRTAQPTSEPTLPFVCQSIRCRCASVTASERRGPTLSKS